jgi:outer membrane protein assembly factor BamD (BamD/ComL family)
MKQKTLLLPLLMLVLTSCGPSRQKEISMIRNIEGRLYSSSATSFDRESADSLLMMYSAFIKKHPGDSLTRNFIFKAGNLFMTEGKGREALEMFDLYMNKYPEDAKTPVCMFFKGYINETIMNDLEKAQEIYILFLEKYPRHDFADDARNALNNLGKTPEQMVAGFEAKKKADSARVADSLKKAGRRKR